MVKRLPVAVEREVLDLLASGLKGRVVAALTGVSKSRVYELRQEAGGMFRPANTSYCRRYLNREDRYEIARLHDQQYSIRAIAVRLGRAPSTISRELRFNATEAGHYAPEHADRVAWERQRRPKPSRLQQLPELRELVQQLLVKRYSPEQVSGRLKLLYPNEPLKQISYETIYRSLFVYPHGELQRELKAQLRRGRKLRHRRGTNARGQIPDAVSIHQRPEEVETRLVPGHHEGDLIMGSAASNSAVGTIVERTTGFLTLLHLPDGHTADKVAAAVSAQMSTLPAWFAKTLTWDRGKEMCGHAKITEATGIAVYFADPYCPYQRPTNENSNGLIREYLPKGSDLSVHTADVLQAIADELNDRPRKRLGYHTPNEAFANLLAQHQAGVATDP